MTQQQFRNLLKASVPIFVLIFTILIYVLFVKKFVYCDWGNCDPIEQSLTDALPIESVEKLAILSNDPPDIAQEKNEKLYEYFSLKLSGRIIWTSVGATYFISSVISLFVGFYIIYKCNNKNKRRSIVMGAALLLAIAVGVLLFQHPEILMRIIIHLSKLTIDREAPGFQRIFHLIVAMGYSAIATLVIAEVHILLPSDALSERDFLVDVKEKTNHLNTILLVGTILLVNAILLLQSVFRWATAFFVQDASMLSLYAQLTQNFITLWAIEFTASLAAMYLPGYLLLQSYALSQPHAKDSEIKKKQLKEMGLMLTPVEILSRILAIIAPLIASPIFDAVMKVMA